VADFETWTAPDLAASCPAAEIRRDSDDGLAPGRYRFEVLLDHSDGSPFAQVPTGDAVLVAGAVTRIASIDVTAARPIDGGAQE